MVLVALMGQGMDIGQWGWMSAFVVYKEDFIRQELKDFSKTKLEWIEIEFQFQDERLSSVPEVNWNENGEIKCELSVWEEIE